MTINHTCAAILRRTYRCRTDQSSRIDSHTNQGEENVSLPVDLGGPGAQGRGGHTLSGKSVTASVQVVVVHLHTAFLQKPPRRNLGCAGHWATWTWISEVMEHRAVGDTGRTRQLQCRWWAHLHVVLLPQPPSSDAGCAGLWATWTWQHAVKGGSSGSLRPVGSKIMVDRVGWE